LAFGLRIGGLGGLRTGAAAGAVSAPAPAPAVGVVPAGVAGVAGVVEAAALDAGASDGLFVVASVAIYRSLQAFHSIK